MVLRDGYVSNTGDGGHVDTQEDSLDIESVRANDRADGDLSRNPSALRLIACEMEEGGGAGEVCTSETHENVLETESARAGERAGGVVSWLPLAH